jgi:uncharacterized surface protein with fasciclin (FAS1) repeats
MKTHILKNHLTRTLAVAIVAVAPCAVQATEHEAAAPAAPKTVVDVAVATPDFSTLVSALQAAELVDALSANGPFTVFAPNNAAFAKLPPGTLEDLLKPENKEQLVGILKNHVLPAKVMASEVASGTVTTLGGKPVEIAVENGRVGFGGARVLATDLVAGNGVIHVIDTVVVPD